MLSRKKTHVVSLDIIIIFFSGWTQVGYLLWGVIPLRRSFDVMYRWPPACLLGTQFWWTDGDVSIELFKGVFGASIHRFRWVFVADFFDGSLMFQNLCWCDFSGVIYYPSHIGENQNIMNWESLRTIWMVQSDSTWLMPDKHFQLWSEGSPIVNTRHSCSAAKSCRDMKNRQYMNTRHHIYSTIWIHIYLSCSLSLYEVP